MKIETRIKIIILAIIILLGLIAVTISANTLSQESQEETTWDTFKDTRDNPRPCDNTQPQPCCDWERSKGCC
jgi:hypothetical protein